MVGQAVSDKIQRIREKFPDKNQYIDLLIAEDPEFLTLCEDYDISVDALRHWTQSKDSNAKTRVNEYLTLVRELQDEIAQALAALESRRLD